MTTIVVMPALNEAQAIGETLRGLAREGGIARVVVVDNGSTDETAAIARAQGATVVFEPRRGYGSACLAGLAALPDDSDVVVFMDADGADDARDLPALLAPLGDGTADLVVGSRAFGHAAAGALTPAQRIGNALAAGWLRHRFGLQATDLGPLRAIRRSSLEALGMRDRGFGWTVEMQIKAARTGLRYMEVPVRYRRRVGRSKISGTLRGTLGASAKILSLLAWYDFRGRAEAGSARRSSCAEDIGPSEGPMMTVGVGQTCNDSGPGETPPCRASQAQESCRKQSASR